VSELLDSLLTEAQAEVAANPPAPYTTAQKRAYKSRGGSPWLDGEYTVFGEVVEGMKIVEDIEKVKTGQGDRPLREIRIIKATVK
jgi:peptidylprolyl isomerase